MEFIDLHSQSLRLKTQIDQNIAKVLSHGKYINGPEVAEIENEIANFTGAKYAIGCASGTDALQLALMALDCEIGDEVITTPFTFIATVEVIMLLKLKPVFVDINPNTYQIDHTKIEAAITPRTKAIIPVSLYGQCSEMDEINAIAKKNNLIVIEDAAQSMGATYKEKKSCNISDIACTSFFPSKPLGCYGDGGMVMTSNEELSKKIRMIRNHGQSKRYVHNIVGLNSRLDSIQAAILLAKMTIFEDEIKARQKIGARYNELLDGIAKSTTLMSHNTSVYAQYTIEVDNRDEVRKRLEEKSIPTAVHYPIGLHMQPVMSKYAFKEGDFPFSERASRRVLSLPMHPYLTEEVQDNIIQELKHCL